MVITECITAFIVNLFPELFSIFFRQRIRKIERYYYAVSGIIIAVVPYQTNTSNLLDFAAAETAKNLKNLFLL